MDVGAKSGLQQANDAASAGRLIDEIALPPVSTEAIATYWRLFLSSRFFAPMVSSGFLLSEPWIFTVGELVLLELWSHGVALG